MRTSTSIAIWVARITGLIQIVLGLLFWTGNLRALVNVHMISGTILVLALWFLAFQAISSGANPGLGYVSIIWGLLTIVLGVTQPGLLPGQFHWVIQVLHLVIGIGAMGLADNNARALSRGRMTAG